MKIHNFKIKADSFLEVIPFASTFSSAVDLVQKILIDLHVISADKVRNSHYYTYLKQKSYGKTLFVAIPILGNAKGASDYNKSYQTLLRQVDAFMESGTLAGVKSWEIYDLIAIAEQRANGDLIDQLRVKDVQYQPLALRELISYYCAPENNHVNIRSVFEKFPVDVQIGYFKEFPYFSEYLPESTKEIIKNAANEHSQLQELRSLISYYRDPENNSFDKIPPAFEKFPESVQIGYFKESPQFLLFLPVSTIRNIINASDEYSTVEQQAAIREAAETLKMIPRTNK